MRYQFPPFSFADTFPIKQTALIFTLACILTLNLFVYISCPPHSPCAKRLLIAEKLTRCLTPKKRPKKNPFLVRLVFFSHGQSSANSRHQGQGRTPFCNYKVSLHCYTASTLYLLPPLSPNPSPSFLPYKPERNPALSFCKIDSRPIYLSCRNAVSLWAAQQALEDL